MNRSSDPKKIAQAIASFVSSNLMHSKSLSLEGEGKFGPYKRKFNTMIDSPQDSHRLDKMNFSMP
jgi:hypothetical protein